LRAGAAALLLLLLPSCGREATNEAEEDKGRLSVAMQSEDAVDGRRPVLTLSCGPGGSSFSLELIRTPDTPPPPRGTFGLIKVDDAPPVRMELAWLGADRWAPRLDHEEEAALVRTMVGGRNVYFSGPEGTTDRAYRWDMGRLGPRVEDLGRACG
jgi:hypothetical protein